MSYRLYEKKLLSHLQYLISATNTRYISVQVSDEKIQWRTQNIFMGEVSFNDIWW